MDGARWSAPSPPLFLICNRLHCTSCPEDRPSPLGHVGGPWHRIFVLEAPFGRDGRFPGKSVAANPVPCSFGNRVLGVRPTFHSRGVGRQLYHHLDVLTLLDDVGQLCFIQAQDWQDCPKSVLN